MADPAGAPGTRAEILAALNGPKIADGYPFRQAIKQWLADDKDGSKAAWLKGS